MDTRQLEESRKISQERKSQIGSGDRSEKIRTYNCSDRRVTDHRINLSLYRLEQILDGELDELSDDLKKNKELKDIKIYIQIIENLKYLLGI